MRLEIGNKVAVLDDVIKGIVKDIQNDVVTIITEDDMEFDFNSSELVMIEQDQRELSKYSDINNPLLLEKTKLGKKHKSIFKKDKSEVVLEIDLHIHQLIPSSKGMDNYDILNYQLDTAKRKIEFAITKKISKIIFIHGVGEGVLKSELTSLLNKYPVKYYDASYKKYGLGATEVYVYQNSN